MPKARGHIKGKKELNDGQADCQGSPLVRAEGDKLQCDRQDGLIEAIIYPQQAFAEILRTHDAPATMS